MTSLRGEDGTKIVKECGFWSGVFSHAKPSATIADHVRTCVTDLQPGSWYWARANPTGLKFAFRSQNDAMEFFSGRAFYLF
jgi:hypothetical protein